jgi:hypothetical protein
MLTRCENLSKLELYTFVARVGISSILIFGPHKTIAEHSYVQLRPGICTVTQSGMLTPPAVFIYTRITHLTQACRTLSRSKLHHHKLVQSSRELLYIVVPRGIY